MNRKTLPVMAITLTSAAVIFFLFGLLRSEPQSVSQSSVISPAEYTARFTQANTRHLLLDVRTPEEYAEGHLPNAINISLQELSSRLSEVPADQPVVVYCRSGNRSNQARELLTQAGYSQVYDLGGIIDWQAQGYPVNP